LEGSFLSEIMQPSIEASVNAIEDQSVPHLPKLPSCDEKNLHEKRKSSHLPRTLNSSVNVTHIDPVNPQLFLALLGEMTIKKQVINGFLNTFIIEDT
jgi:hypothetical protein